MTRVARPIALVGLGVTLLGGVAAIMLRIIDPAPVVPSTFGFADLSLVSFGVLGVTFASVGSLLAVRLPGNAVGWCMIVVGASYALAALAAAVTFSAVADGPPGATNAGLAAWSAVLFSMVGSLIFVLGLIFPTGRGATPAWDRFIIGTAIALPIVIVVGFLVRPGPLQIFPTIDNPFGIGPDLRPIFGKQPSQTMAAVSALIAPVVVWSMVVRYRRADAIGRQQLKWFAVSLIAAVGGMALAALASTLTDRPPEAGLAFFGFAGALVPIAIGISILRYRLYDIDRIISRTVGYAIISVVLAVVFLGLTLLMLAVMATFAQDLVPFASGRTLAVALSTLVAFALFQPVRHRVQDAVDRRFDRSRYDARQMADAFAGRLRDEVDIATVTADLDATVRAAVRPATLGLWVRGPR